MWLRPVHVWLMQRPSDRMHRSWRSCLLRPSAFLTWEITPPSVFNQSSCPWHTLAVDFLAHARHIKIFWLLNAYQVYLPTSQRVYCYQGVIKQRTRDKQRLSVYQQPAQGAIIMCKRIVRCSHLRFTLTNSPTPKRQDSAMSFLCLKTKQWTRPDQFVHEGLRKYLSFFTPTYVFYKTRCRVAYFEYKITHWV